MIIGNGGAEYGVRGYVTAYDTETGDQLWRWFTVPGDPAKPFEDASMAAAAKTWDPAGQILGCNGGGGTPWDSITFDPDLNMVYVGTGNGSPWARKHAQPGRRRQSLSRLDRRAQSPTPGKYVWHYQETPGDNWDYTSTQPMILADITIDGAPRKVILHAPKNGFFFVIDRTNGKFISAKNFVDVNWATGYDANGRPIEMPEARAPRQAVRVDSRPVRRAQLAPDVVQSADRPRLPAGAERAASICTGQQELDARRQRPASRTAASAGISASYSTWSRPRAPPSAA